MAKTTTSAPRSFYEMVLIGPDDMVHGFLAGLVIGAGHEALVCYGPEEDMEGPSLGDKLKQALRVHAPENQVVLDNVTRGLVKKAAKKMYAETGMEIESDRRVRKARFDFKFDAYAPRYGREIRALLDAVRGDVKISSLEIEETHDPKAKGVEAYAATHDYEIEGKGTVHGRFDLVLKARRAMDTHPLIDVGELELDLA